MGLFDRFKPKPYQPHVFVPLIDALHDAELVGDVGWKIGQKYGGTDEKCSRAVKARTARLTKLEEAWAPARKRASSQWTTKSICDGCMVPSKLEVEDCFAFTKEQIMASATYMEHLEILKGQPLATELVDAQVDDWLICRTCANQFFGTPYDEVLDPLQSKRP